MKVIVNGLATEYEDEGAGQIILLLHGWQDDLHTFDALVPLLSPAYRVIRLDLPGFGKSETPKRSWDLDVYVQFINNFVQKLNIHVGTLVGHSFGGRIIIKGNAARKFRTDKIILIGAAGVTKRRRLRNAAIMALAKVGKIITCIPPLIFWRAGLQKKMYRLVGGDYGTAGALRETFLKIISEDLGGSAIKIAMPALLIWGANDTETPISHGERLSKLIRNSELKVINGAGHFVHQEKPNVVAKLIQEFVC